MSEDVNVEHLLDVLMSIDTNSGDVWKVRLYFIQHLYWHKPRETVLRPKIEALPDDHHYKPDCLFELSRLFESAGNHVERKQLLTHALPLQRERGDDTRVALTLRDLSDANRWLGLYKEGIQQAKEASEMYEQLGDARLQVECSNDLAQLLFADNQLDSAEDCASRAVDLIPEKGNEYVVCKLHRTLGNIYRSKGEKEKAIHHIKSALEITSHFHWEDQLFWINYALASLFLDERNFNDAHAYIEKAKAHTTDSQYQLGRAMEIQAIIWYQERRFEDTTFEASNALELFEKLGATEDVGRCKHLLRNAEEAMKIY